MSEKNGGPAFPVAQSWDEQYCDEAGYARTRRVTGLRGGMTLRDYFAAKAIAGILSNPDISASAARLSVATDVFRADTSRAAYAMADAMLKAREP